MTFQILSSTCSCQTESEERQELEERVEFKTIIDKGKFTIIKLFSLLQFLSFNVQEEQQADKRQLYTTVNICINNKKIKVKKYTQNKIKYNKQIYIYIYI